MHRRSEDLRRPRGRQFPTFIAALCLVLAGCTETKFLPPPTELRPQLKTTGVEATPGLPYLSLGNQPISGTGTGALLGAGEGASLGLPVAAGGCMSGQGWSCAVGLVLGAAVAIVAAPVGAAAGAINARSAD